MSNIIKKSKEYRILILCMISAIVLVMLYSWSTSPFYNWMSQDSGVYKVMGWMTFEGRTPYLDLFDHKGPFLVLIETIGYAINSNYGIVLLQIITWFFVFYGTYKLITILDQSKKSIVLLLLSIGLYIAYYSAEGGNVVEEYCLPFIVWSYAYLVAFLKDNVKYHNPKYAILYGVTFTVCLLTRMTNAIPLGVTIIVVGCVLLWNKKWKNVLSNLAMFLIGTIASLVPFIIWFYIKGALYEMLYATFIFNFKYVKSQQIGLFSLDEGKTLLRYLIIFAIALLSLLIGKKYKSLKIAIALQLVTGIWFFASGPKYIHYLLIWIPSVIISFVILFEEKEPIILKRIIAGISACVLGILICVSFIDCYKAYTNNSNVNYEKNIDEIKKNVSNKDLDKVVVLNGSPYIYLYGNFKPCYKYFVLQDFHSNVDKKIKDYIVNSLNNKKAKYIIVEELKNKEMEKELVANYRMINKSNQLKLYEAID